ncbi:MgtC/SapB family protein [Rhizobiaceae bacterium n13]|uniref:MgtC/SapB family protein n=1 Tax=Ferirhizobium litorale TaxID=2927786 RepID=A0AAE3U0D0_9HYPH|nr:MgtC/SapB family protein [Fererhizobium litorale]MDI7861719.1 MgtC/SapB family protein [Fererhizobium litorale]MDI7921939.1 MgtC/SapB family protein [Fererhizobium litorale]
MDELELFQRLGLAIAIGAAVGVERHWRARDVGEGQRTAGIRTFTLIGMLGGITGLLERYLAQGTGSSGILLATFFLALAAVVAAFEYREAVDEESYSATSVVVAMVTFSLGALAVLGDMTIASAGGVIALGILASREFLHTLMKKLQWKELQSAIILLAMTFVLLPIVPADPIGPFGGVSPRKILLLAIMLAGISYCGYIAAKLVGSSKGDVLAGAIGGIVSSTAVAISFAQRSAESGPPRSLAAGVITATAISLVRTGFLVIALAAALVPYLLPPFFAGAAVSLGYAYFLARRGEPRETSHAMNNPFELLSVAKMALLLVFVAFLARAASDYFGQRGLLIASALTGLADVDAVAVTVADMLGSLALPTAALAIGVAVLVNTFAKAVYATAFGVRAFSLHVWIASMLATAAAVATATAGLLI